MKDAGKGPAEAMDAELLRDEQELKRGKRAASTKADIEGPRKIANKKKRREKNKAARKARRKGRK